MLDFNHPKYPEFRQTVKAYQYLPTLLILILASANAADRHSQIQLEIHQLSGNLDKQQNASDDLQAEITQLEKKLGTLERQLYQNEKAIEGSQTNLQKNNEKKAQLDSALGLQKAGLAQQLQALYTAGEQSYLRMLMKQDNPAEISRNMHYFDYMNASRIRRIQSISKTLGDLGDVQKKINDEQDRLQALIKKQSADRSEMQATLDTRASKLNILKSDISSKQKQLGKLQAEDAKFQETVTQIASASSNDTAADPTPVKAQAAKPEPKGIPVSPRQTANQTFSTLKGGLSWPVKGKIIYGYGSRRNEKQSWRGVVIAAPGGSKVRAIARGKVAFSGWMDGYGHLIILQHDNGYLSLYGYNRAVYKGKGTVVNANETIAAVGNSGGQDRDALYFEIRQGTSPQNPARWCR